MTAPWRALLVAAGAGQLVLVAASLAIPRVLRWPEDLARLRPLTRQVFWTYAGYIWATNLSFGLVSAFAPGWLLDRSPLAGAVCGFIAAYWGARLVIQFTYFDRSDAPQGPLFAARRGRPGRAVRAPDRRLRRRWPLRAFGVLGA